MEAVGFSAVEAIEGGGLGEGLVVFPAIDGDIGDAEEVSQGFLREIEPGTERLDAFPGGRTCHNCTDREPSVGWKGTSWQSSVGGCRTNAVSALVVVCTANVACHPCVAPALFPSHGLGGSQIKQRRPTLVIKAGPGWELLPNKSTVVAIGRSYRWVHHQ